MAAFGFFRSWTKPELDKNPIPTSPPKLTPVVLTALHILLVLDKPVLAQLLLLGQDLDFITLAEGNEHLSLGSFVLPQAGYDYDAFLPALKAVNNRFLGKDAWSLDGKSKEREFMDLQWCQDYFEGLFGMGFGYMIAVNNFVDAMVTYGMGGRHSSQSLGMPHWNDQHGLRTLNALAVMGVVGALQEKPQWQSKVNDETIVDKWKEEALEQGLDPTVADIAVKDLKWLRGTHDPLTGGVLTHIPQVYVTNSLVDLEDLSALKDTVAALEDVPEKLKGWHPGSDGQVLDLVHPSLHPYVHGRTPRYIPEDIASEANEAEASDIHRMAFAILKRCSLPIRNAYPSPEAALNSVGEGSLTSGQSPRKDTIEILWPCEPNFSGMKQGSKYKYQWLPTDVSISIPNPGFDDIPWNFPTARFLSYINNVYPDPSTRTGKLYPVLERILAKFIPLFERVLSSPVERTRPRFPEPNYLDGSRGNSRGLRPGGVGLAKPTQAKNSGNRGTDNHDQNEDEPRWEPPRFRFKPSGQLQVIVKLANIHLTPGKPEYPGGSWHVEDTERIVATGLYYYDSENITTSKLSFRVAVGDPDAEDYHPNRFEPLERKYGILQGSTANQFLGSVVTEQGRCITFPNNMQHRVEPFSLADRTKAGHRKILAFFLINPKDRVISTSDVPPQQFEWYTSEIKKGKSRLSKLPTEIFNLIMEQAAVQANEEGYPWPMSWTEALRHRELLMKERGKFAVRAKYTYEREFSFCEH